MLTLRRCVGVVAVLLVSGAAWAQTSISIRKGSSTGGTPLYNVSGDIEAGLLMALLAALPQECFETTSSNCATQADIP
jgi:hypothetical protein